MVLYCTSAVPVLSQCFLCVADKQVFKNFDILGWYSIGPSRPGLRETQLLKQLLQVNDNPILLKFDPESHGTRVSLVGCASFNLDSSLPPCVISSFQAALLDKIDSCRVVALAQLLQAVLTPQKMVTLQFWTQKRACHRTSQIQSPALVLSSPCVPGCATSISSKTSENTDKSPGVHCLSHFLAIAWLLLCGELAPRVFTNSQTDFTGRLCTIDPLPLQRLQLLVIVPVDLGVTGRQGNISVRVFVNSHVTRNFLGLWVNYNIYRLWAEHKRRDLAMIILKLQTSNGIDHVIMRAQNLVMLKLQLPFFLSTEVNTLQGLRRWHSTEGANSHVQ